MGGETLRNDRLLSLDEAADYLGMTVDHDAPGEAMRYLCRQGKVKYVKISNRLRFRRAWLDAFIDGSAVPPIG